MSLLIWRGRSEKASDPRERPPLGGFGADQGDRTKISTHRLVNRILCEITDNGTVTAAHQISIQYLRAIAALMVVVFHCFHSVQFMRPHLDSFVWMKSGVDIFFVISGYVMVTSTAGKKLSPWQFAKQRIRRIVPIYWIASALVICAGIHDDWLFALKSFFFVAAANPINGLIQPLVQPGWSLNYEMFFYLLFALTLWLPEKMRLGAMTILIGTLVATGMVLGLTGVADFYTRTIMIEFLLGMAIARYRPGLHWMLVPFGFAALSFSALFGADRFIIYGLPAAAIVAGALSAERSLPHWRWLAFLGDSSYAIYLFHIPLLGALVALWKAIDADMIWFVPTALVLICVSGALIHQLVEKPIADRLASKQKPTQDNSKQPMLNTA